MPARRTLALLALAASAPLSAQESARDRATPIAPPAATVISAGAVSVPMEQDDGGRPIVSVYLGDAGPYRFGIDFGANLLAVSTRVGEELGLRRTPGEFLTEEWVTVPDLRIGDAQFQGLTSAFGGFLDESVDGILGVNVFENVLLTLDYPNEVVRIADQTLPPVNGRTVLTLADTTLGSRPSVEFTVAGSRFVAVLDTRSPSVMTLPDSQRRAWRRVRTEGWRHDPPRGGRRGGLARGSGRLSHERSDPRDQRQSGG